MAKQKAHPKNLAGKELTDMQHRCEMDGFADVCRKVIRKVRDGDVRDVTKAELDFLIKKLGSAAS